jgi:hypothetical protein
MQLHTIRTYLVPLVEVRGSPFTSIRSTNGRHLPTCPSSIE